MASLAQLAIIAEFNTIFQNFIIYDCPCYNKNENFSKYFESGTFYRACIVVKSFLVHNNEKIESSSVFHLVLPIMLHSNIDHHLRVVDPNETCGGLFFINGRMVQLSCFITNNLNRQYRYSFKDSSSKKKERIERVYLRSGKFQ